MLEAYFHTLLALMKRRHSTPYRLISLIAGAILFLIILPAALFVVGWLISHAFRVEGHRWVEISVAWITIPLGLFWLSWATLVQWRIGKGTPAPIAPTQKLVVTGPYRLCRNPIELGAILYYLGLGSCFGNLAIGLVCSSLGFVLGTTYHRFVEEKELTLRFGDEYLAYKRKVPFLIPTPSRLGQRRGQ
jgi:protein-S-isoprenylcysteine O-methyltransferase Ste14